ncbi:MAG: Hpt domain-containing protein, partial [Myxococcales bacterium]|nr:Hpt domain-containing protein [Myxococcales bacterium]
MARVATALNAFLDKLWLQEFQLQAKQEMLEKVVEIRTREVHEILDNVSSGFLIARPDGTVLPNFSRSCVRIFGREDLEGQPLAALMGLDERARANFQAAWDQVFADFLPLDLCLDQLPADFALDGRSYRMDASPITDATGRVTKLFVTLGDTTELRQVEAQNALRQALLEIVRQRDAFRAFLNETRRALGEVRDDPRQLALRAALHTIKGNLGCFGLHDLAALVHSMEDAAEIRVEDLDTLEETLRRFLAAHGDVVGMGYEDDGQSSVVDLERVVPVLESLAHEPSTLRRRLEIDHFLTHLSWVPAGTLLASLRGVVERVAERLEKEVDLEIGGDDVLVDPETMGPVFSSLVHLVRNSLDHGIEATWERGDKPARGQIAVQCGAEDGAWVVRARDDGRGVDVDALVAR